MGTTADKLLYLQDTKSAIKEAIVAKGVDIPSGTTFRDYADKIGDITTGSSNWVRPAEWLALPDNVDGVQKVSILNAVFDTDSEFIAMIFEGDYTVDWGDGVVENFALGVKAEHKYEYSNVNLNSDTVATFGYKQCIITVTPQVGNNLTLINLNTYPSIIGSLLNSNKSVNFLDIRINSSYCTLLILASQVKNTNRYYARLYMLEQSVIGEIADSVFSYMFSNCMSLQSSIIKYENIITNMEGIHTSNRSLKYIPDYNFSNVISLANAFSSCWYLLSEDKVINTTSSLASLSNTFNGCSSLTKGFRFLNTDNVLTISSMYSNCTMLSEIPTYSFPLLAGTNTFVSSCYSLRIIPNITVGKTASFNFSTNYNLIRMLMPIYTSFTVANNKMSATALNEMYTALPTVTGQTVTVTGNYGVSWDDPTIATAKGWTVVG